MCEVSVPNGKSPPESLGGTAAAAPLPAAPSHTVPRASPFIQPSTLSLTHSFTHVLALQHLPCAQAWGTGALTFLEGSRQRSRAQTA